MALQEYKCPCCGGALEFDSTIQKMKCPYCDTEFEVKTLQEMDEELNKEQGDDMSWETSAGKEWADEDAKGLRTYVCKSCGGEIIAEETTAASSCPFCGNPVVMMEQLSGSWKPDLVIPFKLDKKAAKEGFRKYLKGKKLLPKVFSEENHLEEIKGVYVPFWLFQADADARMRYKATRVRTWSDSRYNYTETSFYSVVRAGEIGFDRVPVDGSTKMVDDLMEALEPFHAGDAVDFQTAYLAGYLADKYDVSAQDSIERANQRIRKSTEQAFARTVQGYASVIPENSNIRLTKGKTQYALYPVWLLRTVWKDKQYMFAMNGQTGKFVGDLPLDKGAYCKWLFGLTGILGAVVLLISYLSWLG